MSDKDLKKSITIEESYDSQYNTKY